MSTGKRLAKRSIIGTRVCAPAFDGKYYCGVISGVNTPQMPEGQEMAGLNITPNTRYAVRLDPMPNGGVLPASKGEFCDSDLIGPGFGSVTGAKLMPGQKVYLTYNGREIQAEVTQHREDLDEVEVLIAPSGQEGTTSLTKRIDEVRLLPSRKSARLADSDTDFARLADMGSDRKRASSHSIDVPQVIGSRKRRPSSSNDSVRCCHGWTNSMGRRECFMDECSAAMVLMSLSTPPKDLLSIHCQQLFGSSSWDDQVSSSSNHVVVGSPGVGGTSNSSSSSSSASWRSGTPSPPLSDEGALSSNGLWPSITDSSAGTSTGSSAGTSTGSCASTSTDTGPIVNFIVNTTANNNNNNLHHHQYNSHSVSNDVAHHSSVHTSHRYSPYHTNHHHHHHHSNHAASSSGGSSSSSPNFTTHDEGIVPDLDHERPRKRKIRCRVENDDYIESSSNDGSSSDNDVKTSLYKCSWREDANGNGQCEEVSYSWHVVAEHVLRTHLNGHKAQENEEDFYIIDEPLQQACSPPTKSHWDMVRPRSEDPEYQEQLRLAASPVQQNNSQIAAAVNTQNIVIRDVFSMASASTPSKQFKPSPRPLQAYNASNISLVTVSLGKMPHSPRRVRGETKKCRKVYGMEHKELWCTQCKWKKACTRFSD